MRRVSLVLALMFLSSVAGAQTSSITYVGVYFDDIHDIRCVSQTAPYTVELWVWALTGTGGLSGAVFDMEFGGAEIQGDPTYHPNIMPRPTACQKPCPFFSRGYADCQTGWVWLFHQTILVTSSDPADIYPVPFLQDFTDVVIWDCSDVERPATVLSTGHLNYCGPLPVRSATWGAIKSLYR